MTYDLRIHHRRSIRLRGYDYAGGGAYFITICTQDKEFLFGQVVEGKMILSEQGSIVQGTWDALPQRFSSLVKDAFQMMPNHLHAIFVLPGPGLSEALALATGTPVIQPTPSNFVGRFHENDRIVGVGPALLENERQCKTGLGGNWHGGEGKPGEGKPSPYETGKYERCGGSVQIHQHHCAEQIHVAARGSPAARKFLRAHHTGYP